MLHGIEEITKLEITNTFYFCIHDNESIDHVFNTCPFV